MNAVPEIREAPGAPWVIIAPNRRDRIAAFAGGPAITPADCPFCPGHEAETPPEITRTADGSAWRMRVVPNKYPAIEGGHEVIIETREHSAGFDELPPRHAEDAVRLYMDRYEAHGSSAQVLLFKNEGRLSGASIPHPHSQLLALDRLTPRLAAEIAVSSCTFCESGGQGPLVSESESFRVVAPAASRFAYQMAIVPRNHAPDFAQSREEAGELAHLMQKAVGAIRQRARATAFNWIFMNGHDSFHWYLELTPRLTVPGGFEIGSGTFINVVAPETAAADLRPFFTE